MSRSQGRVRRQFGWIDISHSDAKLAYPIQLGSAHAKSGSTPSASRVPVRRPGRSTWGRRARLSMPRPPSASFATSGTSGGGFAVPDGELTTNGRAIAIGRPFGANGARDVQTVQVYRVQVCGIARNFGASRSLGRPLSCALSDWACLTPYYQGRLHEGRKRLGTCQAYLNSGFDQRRRRPTTRSSHGVRRKH
jgi:hypothetical protein